MMRANVCDHGMSVVYANLVGGQDELIFDGNSFVLDQSGALRAHLQHCVEDLQVIEFEGAQPVNATIVEELPVEAQVYKALVLGVRDYVGKNGFPGALIGMSGGVDSALTLAVAVDALGADKVRAIMMPSPYTADISWIDSRDMVGACRCALRRDSDCRLFRCLQSHAVGGIQGTGAGHDGRKYPGAHSRHHPDGAVEQAWFDCADDR
jgi:hypothetical protein